MYFRVERGMYVRKRVLKKMEGIRLEGVIEDGDSSTPSISTIGIIMSPSP